MIISFFDNEQNQNAIHDLNDGSVTVSYFPNFSFDNSNKLTLISLDAKGTFQKLIAPKVLMERLLKSGLPNSITEVEILVSDIANDTPLLDYGMKLGKEFLANNREVAIKIPMNNDGQTLIIPPESKGDDWQFFLIDDFSNKQQVENFQTLQSKSKTLIFQGKLENFLQEDNCIITSKEIARSAQRAEISQNPFYRDF